MFFREHMTVIRYMILGFNPVDKSKPYCKLLSLFSVQMEVRLNVRLLLTIHKQGHLFLQVILTQELGIANKRKNNIWGHM